MAAARVAVMVEEETAVATAAAMDFAQRPQARTPAPQPHMRANPKLDVELAPTEAVERPSVVVAPCLYWTNLRIADYTSSAHHVIMKVTIATTLQKGQGRHQSHRHSTSETTRARAVCNQRSCHVTHEITCCVLLRVKRASC